MADKISKKELSEQYGMAWAVLKGVPELWKLFEKAYGDGKTRWSPEKFKAQFQSSNWYKNNSEAWRKSRILELSDPKSFEAEVNRVQAEVERLATERGIVIRADRMPLIAKALYRTGRTDAASVLEYLEGDKNVSPRGVGFSQTGGAAGDTVQRLQAMAWDYGWTPADENFYAKAAREVALGNQTPEFYEDQMRAGAASKYRVFKEQILSGSMTVRDVASSYLNAMAQTLEIPVESIDLEDPEIQKAIATSFNDKGEPVVKSVWEFTKDLKNDPRWGDTKNARDSMESTAVGVLRAFGFQS